MVFDGFDVGDGEEADAAGAAIAVAVAPGAGFENDVAGAVGELVAGDALELGGGVGFDAGFAAEALGEDDGALVGDHVDGFSGFLSHPDGTGEHADAD